MPARPQRIEVPVSGGGGVLFNDLPTPAGVQAIAASHRRHGTTGLLVTLISDHELGGIQPGYRADLVLLDGELRARRTWIGGR